MSNKIFKSLLKEIENPYASVLSDGSIYDSAFLIDTGILLLNAQICGDIFGGFPSNRILIFAGEQSTGKTFIMLNIMRKFIQDNNDKALIVLFETEGAIDTQLIKERGIDPSKVMIVPISSVEDFKVQSTKLVNTLEKMSEEERPPIIFGLDSIGMLASDKEMTDALEGKNTVDMTRAKQLKSAFRILTLALAKNNIPLIATNHTYNSMGGFISKKIMGGGTAAYYSASTVAFLGKGQAKTNKVLTGSKVFCKLEKSRLTKEKTSIEFDIDFEKGICRYSGLFEFLKTHSIIKKSGSKYFLDDPKNAKESKEILEKPEEFFTEEVLETHVRPHLKELFKYGSPLLISEDEEE